MCSISLCGTNAFVPSFSPLLLCTDSEQCAGSGMGGLAATETKKKNRASVGRSVLFGSGSCLSAGAGCEHSSQGRPFSAFPTIHRIVGIACGDRLRTHFVAVGDAVKDRQVSKTKTKQPPLGGTWGCLSPPQKVDDFLLIKNPEEA